VLLLVMSARALRTRKVMPAGVISLLSAGTLYANLTAR
jgi:uncharacterized membrane protein (UPF0136 family)